MTETTGSLTGHLYGVHRVVVPDDVLPLDAATLNPQPPLYRNELRVAVQYVAIHPECLRTLFAQSANDSHRVAGTILARTKQHGKLSSGAEPVGFLAGVVEEVGPDYYPVAGQKPEVGDTVLVQSDVAALPLAIDSIDSINFQNGLVALHATTYLCPTISLLTIDPLPTCTQGNSDDADERIVASAFLPLQFAGVHRAIEEGVRGGRKVLVLGSSRDALLCAAMIRETSTFSALYGFDTHVGNLSGLQQNHVYDVVGIGSVDDAVTVLDGALKMTGDELVDVVVHATYEPRTALSAVLPLRDQGTIVATTTIGRRELEVAASVVSRKVEVVEASRPLLTSQSYQEYATYFAKLLKMYTALYAVL